MESSTSTFWSISYPYNLTRSGSTGNAYIAKSDVCIFFGIVTECSNIPLNRDESMTCASVDLITDLPFHDFHLVSYWVTIVYYLISLHCSHTIHTLFYRGSTVLVCKSPAYVVHYQLAVILVLVVCRQSMCSSMLYSRIYLYLAMDTWKSHERKWP